MAHHSPERRKYLSDWSRKHCAMLRAMPLVELRKMPSTIYTRRELNSKRRQQKAVK
jgi:hypothetical protein